MVRSAFAAKAVRGLVIAAVVGGSVTAEAQTLGDLVPELSPTLTGPDRYGETGPGVKITHDSFLSGSDDVGQGCVNANQSYKLLRFQLYTQNDGYADVWFYVDDDPGFFSQTVVDGVTLLKNNFAEFKLLDATGRQVSSGFKNRFSLSSDYNIPYRPDGPGEPRGINGVNEYVTLGWADEYGINDLVASACQFVPIDGLQDGTYELVVDENAGRYVTCSPPLDSSCRYDGRVYDNAMAMRIQISGDVVTPLSPVIDNASTAIGPTVSPMPAGAPAVVTRHIGTYDLFYVGTDGSLYQISQGTDGTWQPSGSGTKLYDASVTGNPLAAGPLTAVAATRDSVDVFATAQSGDVVHISWSPTSWSVPPPYGLATSGQGAAAGSGPIAVAAGPQSAMVAWFSPSGSVLYGLFDGTNWGQVQTMSGLFTSGQTPALTSSGDGMFHIFARNRNGNGVVYNQFSAAAWGAWRNPGSLFAPPVGNLTAASPYLNRADVFANTSDHRLVRNTWDGTNNTFSGWIDDLATDCIDTSTNSGCSATLDTHVGSPPFAMSTGAQSLDVFYYDTVKPDRLYRMHYDGTTVTGSNQTVSWQLTDLGRPFSVTLPMWPIAAASWADHTFDVFQKYLSGQIGVRSMR
jgi:hypothetical protein